MARPVDYDRERRERAAATRRHVVDLLRGGPATLAEIIVATGLGQTAVTNALALLESDRLVRRRTDDRCYVLADAPAVGGAHLQDLRRRVLREALDHLALVHQRWTDTEGAPDLGLRMLAREDLRRAQDSAALAVREARAAGVEGLELLEAAATRGRARR